jgi:hypothetical protein
MGAPDASCTPPVVASVVGEASPAGLTRVNVYLFILRDFVNQRVGKHRTVAKTGIVSSWVPSQGPPPGQWVRVRDAPALPKPVTLFLRGGLCS